VWSFRFCDHGSTAEFLALHPTRCDDASAGSAAFPALASPRHRLGIILLASTKWSASRPEPAKSPKTPNFGQFAKNPTLYKPRGALLLSRPLSGPWWNIERGRAAAKRAKACAVF
jgi:hypothetical protein